MPGIFSDGGDIATSATLANGVDTLEGYQHYYSRPMEAGVVSLSSAMDSGTSAFNVYIRFYNGANWMKYHQAVDDDLTKDFDANNSDKFECSLKNQEFWKEPVFGIQVKIIRASGSGDIDFTNGLVNPLP